MRVKFHYVEWENLFSYGAQPTRVDLDSHRTTLLVGTNGSGKSTVMDAITFALFNKPWRKINKGELINTLNGKGLLVTLEFSIGSKRYKIVRGSKPNVFDLYCDGELPPSQTSRDQQEYLENYILRMNYKTFCQVVILGKSFVPFMQLSTPDRRSIVEDLLDLNVFSLMVDDLKKSLKEIDSDRLETSQSLNNERRVFGMKEKHVEQLQAIANTKKKKTKDLRKKYDEAIARYEELNEKNKEISAIYNEYRELLDAAQNAEYELKRCEEEQKRLHKELRKYETKDTKATCPTCKQPLPHDSLAFQKAFKDAKEAFTVAGIQVEKQQNILENARVKLDHERFKDIEKRLEEIRTDITSAKTEIRMLEEEFEEDEVPEFDLDAEIANLNSIKKNIQKYEKKLIQIEKIRDIYDLAIGLTRDDIRKYIIKSYIPKLNDDINRYLTLLGLDAKVYLNESFEETIYIRGTDQLSYYGLSEGQKTRIDLAILFAWRALAAAKNSVSTNLLFLDEILDTSMDAFGCEAFLSKLIAEENDQTNVFVISHREEAVSEYFDRILRAEMRGLYSTLKTIQN